MPYSNYAVYGGYMLPCLLYGLDEFLVKHNIDKKAHEINRSPAVKPTVLYVEEQILLC